MDAVNYRVGTKVFSAVLLLLATEFRNASCVVQRGASVAVCWQAAAGSRWQTSNPSSGWTSGCSFLSSCFSLVLQLLKRKVPVPLILSRIAVLAHWLRHLVTAILWITKDINVEGVLLFSYTPPGTKQGVTWIKKKKKINPRLFSPSGGTEVMSTAK